MHGAHVSADRPFCGPLLQEAARQAGAGEAPNAPGLVLLNPDTIFLPADSDRPDPEWLSGLATSLTFSLLWQFGRNGKDLALIFII